MRQLTFLHLGFALCIMLVSISYTSSGKMTSKAGIQKNGPGADYLQALLRFEPWAESVWIDYPKIPDSG